MYSTIASPRKAARKRQRKPSEFARIYGSKERVEFVKSLKCSACGVQGFSENAHVAPASEKGTGYKAGWEWIVPLCGPQNGWRNLGWGGEFGPFIGCHLQFDEFRGIFNALHPEFDPIKASVKTEKDWKEFKGDANK